MISVLTVVAAVGSGLIAGLMFAFSAFLMTAFGKLPAAQGMAAMQSINVTILNPLFGLVFGGTTLACAALAVATPFTSEPGAGWRLTGALLLVIGVFVVTMAFSVPLNNALEEADPASAEGVQLWEHYLSRWTAWNHVRTVTAIGATTTLILALR
jgi:uncharacterized membrane protein